MPVKALQMITHIKNFFNKKIQKIKNFFISLCLFTCPWAYKFDTIISKEMKKFLFVILSAILSLPRAECATRSENAVVRSKNTQNTNAVTQSVRNTASRSRAATVNKTVSARSAKPVALVQQKSVATRSATRKPTKQNVISRAATNSDSEKTQTRTGSEYEQCKTAFFTCMDQFCQLKNDSFRRCSCSDRIYKFQEASDSYQKATERLTEFSENLDVVGMTKEQATAMKTASAGEDALTADKSASKQLLQAIMNAINGEKTNVSGKYESLNSVSMMADMSNAFGMENSGQIIASYNGATLYKAVYPQCRSAVKDDCNDASLQRAVNAYLMAIEQDCNTVESALVAKQKTLKSSVKQGSAMLDLARVENRKKHNSDDNATCITNVATTITSEEVCGKSYHKCLDYGQFIDVTSGAPLTGVSDFYKLGELLTFKSNEDIQNQKLSKIPSNRDFVQFFENKTKKFATEPLDNCTENADTVWQEYLDMALLDIYYAQQSKVKDVQQNCMDLVSACYEKQSTAIANAMTNLTGDSSILIEPMSISLTTQMCDDYIQSCNNMFGGDIIKKYLANKDNADSETACRSIAQQCFDKFGGSGYENFYYPQSGLFEPGHAMDWFTLYDENNNIISPCAQELSKTEGCSDSALLERVFGGFDKNDIDYKYPLDGNTTNRQIRPYGVATSVYSRITDILINQCEKINGYFVEYRYGEEYGYKSESLCQIDSTNDKFRPVQAQNASVLDNWYHFITDEDMCPLNYAINVDVQSWGACSCWENGGYRSKNGQATVCRPLLRMIYDESNSSDTDPVCDESKLVQGPSSSLSSEDGSVMWCQQTTTSSSGQLCPTMSTPVTETSEDTGKQSFCSYNGSKISVVADQVSKR